MTKAVSAAFRAGTIGLALVGLAACSSGPKTPTVSAAPPPTGPQAEATPTAPVAQATIRDVQTALQQAGYYKNARVDGLWGPRTQRAVRRFQHHHNLTANGQLDIPTMRALNLTGNPPSTSNNAAANTAPAGSNTAPAAANTAPPGDNTAPDNTAGGTNSGAAIPPADNNTAAPPPPADNDTNAPASNDNAPANQAPPAR
jgi:peptidoglycan hydrolase-like protein with peptidoglycan-binding domain